MIESYVVRFGGESYGSEDLEKLAEFLEGKFEEAIIFTNGKAIYFKKFEEGSVTIQIDKRNIGAVRLDENSLLKRLEMKLKLEKVEEIFELAERIDNMSFEEFIKNVG